MLSESFWQILEKRGIKSDSCRLHRLPKGCSEGWWKWCFFSMTYIYKYVKKWNILLSFEIRRGPSDAVQGSKEDIKNISPIYRDWFQNLTKGALQKLLSGFCPLRGYPPPPYLLNGQSFCQKTLNGQGGGPPSPLTENTQKNFQKNGSKRAKISVFWPKIAVF